MQSSTTSLLDVLHKALGMAQIQPTLHSDNVPLVYREPGVVTGYRPPGMGMAHYFKSAFQKNNETINIWTHAIGFLVIFVKTMTYLPFYLDGDARYWPILAFGLCCLLHFTLSTAAHTFHSHSPYMHYICYQLDYLGIAQFTLGGSILMIYLHITDDIVPISFAHWLLPVNVLLGWIGFLCCSIAKLRYRRPYPFQRKLWQVIPLAAHASSNVLLVGPRFWRCLMSPSCHFFWDEPGLAFMLVGVVAGLVCIVSFSSHLPEKVWPGKFDFIGQGHQVFHVFSTVMALLQFQSAEEDLLHYDRVNRIQMSLWQVPAAILGSKLACLLTILIIHPLTARRVKEDEEAERKAT